MKSVAAILLALTMSADASEPPYPHSAVIDGIEWHWETLTISAFNVDTPIPVSSNFGKE